MTGGFMSAARSRLARMRANGFYKSVAWVAGGTAVAQAVTILSTPVVTRLYTPADYGVFAVFTAILGVLQPLATLTYAMAIPLAEDRRQAQNVLKLCLAIVAGISLLLGVAVIFSGGFLAAWFEMPAAEAYLWLLPICLLGAGCYESLSGWALREKHFRIMSSTQISQSVSSAGAKIGLGFLGIQPLGLLLGLLASSVAGSFSLLRKLVQTEPEALQSFSRRELWAAAVRFKAFPQYRSWSRLLLGLNVRLPVFLMAALFDPVSVGYFGLASTMVDLPMSLIGNSVSKVFYAEIARFGKERPDKILRLSMSIMKKMSALGILAASALVIAGPWMFSLVFGPEWNEAGIFARWLAIAIMLRFVSSPVMHCLDVLEMQGLQLLINIVRVVIVSCAFGLAWMWGLAPVETAGLYASGLALFYALVIGAIVWLLRSRAARMAGDG
ncbi:MAG: oligosaccharide flippase family protein [Candidatus Hydrogenedentes bacterium]|nr:oligosaccharide flippase family protein [Candidatus Hydrogenedentota bacterium]